MTMDALVWMINRTGQRIEGTPFRTIVNDDGVFVLASDVAEANTKRCRCLNHPVSELHASQAGKVLADIKDKNWPEGSRAIFDPKTGKKSSKQRWIKLDLSVLISYAEEYGFKCENIKCLNRRSTQIIESGLESQTEPHKTGTA